MTQYLPPISLNLMYFHSYSWIFTLCYGLFGFIFTFGRALDWFLGFIFWFKSIDAGFSPYVFVESHCLTTFLPYLDAQEKLAIFQSLDSAIIFLNI